MTKRTSIILFLIIFLHSGVAWALEGCLGLNRHMTSAQLPHASVSNDQSAPRTAQVHASLQRNCCEARTGIKWIARLSWGTNLRSASFDDPLVRDIYSRMSPHWVRMPQTRLTRNLEQILQYSYLIGIHPYLVTSVLLI